MTETILTVVDRAPAGGRMLRLLLRSPLAAAAAIVLIAIVLIAVIGGAVTEGTAFRQDLELRFLAPFSGEHGPAYLLGADALGRPVALLLIAGARTSLTVAVVTVLVSALIGATVGLLAGYLGGVVEVIVMRIAEIFDTIPSLLLALAILYVLGPSPANLIVVLAFTRIPVYLRVCRAQALELRQRMFVESSRALGAGWPRIIWRDVAPMALPSILTIAMLEIGSVILAAAGLSFLGVGLQGNDIDWGVLVADGRGYLATAWWVTFFPGVAIVITALSANIIANWLRAVQDPAQAAGLIRPLATRKGSR